MTWELDTGFRYRSSTHCSPLCTYATTRFTHFVKQLRVKGLWPLTELDTQSLDTALETMKVLQVDATNTASCTSGRCVADKAPPHNDSSCSKICCQAVELGRKATSLCYDNARLGRLMDIGLCGHRHT